MSCDNGCPERQVAAGTSAEKGVRAILNGLGKALIMTAATASVITMAAAPSLATSAKTWTVAHGGAISSAAKNVKVNDTTAGQSMTCTLGGRGLAEDWIWSFWDRHRHHQLHRV